MSLFSKKMDYALLVLSHLHRSPSGSSAREIASQFSISRPFVANILKVLCHHGVLGSHRGVHGGYILLRKAEEISLAEIMDAIEEPFHLADCNHSSNPAGCKTSPFCTIKSGMGEVHERVKGILSGFTLAEILNPHKSAPGQFGLELISAGTDSAFSGVSTTC